MSNIHICKRSMYDELWNLAHELTPWFDIDKVKPYAVYVWSKDFDDPDNPFGENIFDIYHDYLQFYRSSRCYKLPNEAMPIIKKIQEKLKEIEEYKGDIYTCKED